MSSLPYRAVLFVLAFVGAAACGPSDETAPQSAPASLVDATYVGDETCATCHGELYASFHETGMGRSVSRFDPETAPERFEGVAPIYNAAFDYYYEPFVRGDSLFQREFRLGPDGDVVYERIHRADFVVGSGRATRSYFMVANGYVTEMPLTWYVERARWDLSPAYEQHNFRFSRPITKECMTCHNGLPEATPAAENHYADVPLGITCERCHGPGSEHVDRRLAGTGPADGAADPSVVNPARLDRDLQLGVCAQCHLTGLTVYAEGEDETSFRPGTPLAAHRAVFATRERVEDPERFGIASHAERLARSACFEASEMTCTTCHDPHQPVASLGADHFDAVCQDCHTPGDAHEFACSRTEDLAIEASCTSCHLQQSGTSDIPHVTFTDHWIRRTVPPARDPDDIERILVRETPFALVRLTDAPDDADRAAVEEAIAYFKLYETEHALPAYLPRVVDGLRGGVAAGAADAGAREVLGRALLEQGRVSEAVAALRDARAVAPDDPHIAYWLGAAELRAGRAAAAAAALRDAVDAAPALVEAWLKLGEAEQAAGRLPQAEAAFRAAVERDPEHHPGGWNNLGFTLLQGQRLDEAEAAFERALALDPDLALGWINLGTVDLLRGDWPRAEARFEAALRADPSAVAALGNLAMARERQGDTAGAREALRRLLALQPGDPRAAAMLRELDAR